MLVAHLSCSRDGPAVTLRERPWWAVACEWVGDGAGPATGHLFCCRLPEWTWKAGFGHDPYSDEDPEYDLPRWSLGRVMYGFGQWMCGGFGTWRAGKEIARLPVTAEWVRQHFPDSGILDLVYDDEMSVIHDEAEVDGRCTECGNLMVWSGAAWAPHTAPQHAALRGYWLDRLATALRAVERRRQR